MAQRVTLRKRQPYNTSSNRRRVVKTPGGKLVVHHLKKKAVSILIWRLVWLCSGGNVDTWELGYIVSGEEIGRYDGNAQLGRA